jgi:hypothetical protein
MNIKKYQAGGAMQAPPQMQGGEQALQQELMMFVERLMSMGPEVTIDVLSRATQYLDQLEGGGAQPPMQ